jgi:hypothetical protein
MAWTHDPGCIGLCLSLLCAGAFAARANPSRDAGLHADLLRLSQRRIFFGHQSVGMNLLDGVREISARYPDVRFRVIDASADVDPGQSTGAGGHRELHDWNGSKIPAVLPAYTDDGGHLAPDARVRFARELVALLASEPPVP